MLPWVMVFFGAGAALFEGKWDDGFVLAAIGVFFWLDGREVVGIRVDWPWLLIAFGGFSILRGLIGMAKGAGEGGNGHVAR